VFLLVMVTVIALGSRTTTGQQASAEQSGSVESTSKQPSDSKPKDPGDTRLKDPPPKEAQIPLMQHAAAVRSVAFSPDGKKLVACSHDGIIKIWDPATGKQLDAMQHDDTHFMGPLAFGLDSNTLAVGCGRIGQSRFFGVMLLGIKDKKVLLAVSTGAPTQAIALSPDGKTIAWGSTQGTFRGDNGRSETRGAVRLYDASTGELKVAIPKAHGDAVWSLAFAPDGKAIVSVSQEAVARVWDTASGNLVSELSPKGKRNVALAVAYSTDGKRIATGSSLGSQVRVWDGVTFKELSTLNGHTGDIHAVGFSSDGKWLASGGRDKLVKIWDVASGTERATLKGHDQVVWSLAFSPDGKVLATGSFDKTVRLWSVETGKELTHRQ
jgi:WD40 repeat protein